MKTKSIATLTIGFLLFGMLVSLVPTASAQAVPPATFSFEVSGASGSPKIPLEEAEKIDIDWIYSISGTALQGALSSTQGTATITFDVSCTPNEVVMTGTLVAQVLFAPGATDVEKTGTATVYVYANRDAPGLVPITCEVSGSATGIGAAVPAPNDWGPITFSITPDYFSLVEASAPVKLSQGGPQKEVPYTIDVTNFGNAQTRIKWSFLEGGTPGGDWQGLLPDEVILDAKGGDASSKQAVFTVSTPYKNGWNNAQGAYTLVITPEYALNKDKSGSTVQITILTRVRGVYVPSIEPFLMVGAVLGSAMVVRMARDRDEE